MEKLSTTVDQAGRVLIPAKLRKRLDLKPGSDVQISLHGEALVITTRKQAIVKAQAYFSKFANPGKLVSSELIADRRREARREYGR